jgi:hypothetical protein
MQICKHDFARLAQGTGSDIAPGGPPSSHIPPSSQALLCFDTVAVPIIEPLNCGENI